MKEFGNGESGAFSDRWIKCEGQYLESHSPINDELIGKVRVATESEYEEVVKSSQATFLKWRSYPAPKRGEVVRQMAQALRQKKDELSSLITWEMGKIKGEGEGEVQEAIDIADFAVGLSRQLYGMTMHSERPGHRLSEQWHPLGPVGVITAFNFPMAVWAWNSMIGAVCGDTIVWKPSQYTPFSAIAINSVCAQVAADNGFPGLFSLLIDKEGELGKRLAADKRIPLISATGSCRMGRSVAETVGRRLGRTILELGGNNGIIVLKDAPLDLVVRSILFGAVGTSGQRCTTIRRIFVEGEIKDQLVARLVESYKQIRIGDPRDDSTLMGPLINDDAVSLYQSAIEKIKELKGKILYGGNVKRELPSGKYVEPTIVEVDKTFPLLKEEIFVPIVYVMKISGGLEEALELHNAVPQGLSSAIFTSDLRKAEQFLSAAGSDCGIANVNIGTSGAEIGGAFGGEKDTGGGRESGSDSWKQYMRRQTCTVNYSDELPLAQGIKFEV